MHRAFDEPLGVIAIGSPTTSRAFEERKSKRRAQRPRLGSRLSNDK